MTQGRAAERMGVSRPTFAQWEAGKFLPAQERIPQLDALLEAQGELAAAAEQARPGLRSAPVTLVPIPPTPISSLRQVLDGARRALLDSLWHDDDGTPVGWRHNLVELDGYPSVASTAYGLKILALHGGPDARTPDVVRWVLNNATVDDAGRRLGWRARAQSAPRMEITGDVILSLLRAGVDLPVDDVVRMLRALLDETALSRPSILCTALEPLLRVAPDADLAEELVRALLACRTEFDGVLLWPEKLVHRDQRKLTPSVAHTARAIAVLRAAPNTLVGDAVAAAERWLTDQDALAGVSEFIRRPLAIDRREDFPLHHFTSAWVVRALAGGTKPDRRRIEHALRYVWDRYDPEVGVWAWGNGDTPVWMLADAVAALHDAALALSPGPAATPGPG